MSNIQHRSPLRALPPPAGPTSLYAAHGLFAPGVRLMRNVNFVVKAILISALFIVTIAGLLYLFVSASRSEQAVTQSERRGLAYNRVLLDVLQQGQTLRREALMALAAGQPLAPAAQAARLQGPLAKLAELDQLYGAELATGNMESALRDGLAKAAGETDPRRATRAYTAWIQLMVDDIATVTRTSQLALDPAQSTFYLMMASFERLPDVLEQSALVHAVGSLALSGQPVLDPLQVQQLNGAETIIAFSTKKMLADLKLVSGAAATNDSAIEQAEVALKRFLSAADQYVIDADTLKPENRAAFGDAGEKALSANFALARQLVDELDRQLEARLAASQRHMYAIGLVVFITIMVAAYFFACFYRATLGGLRLVSSHLKEMAGGDLRRAPADPLGNDEPAIVIRDLQKTYAALHELIRVVRHSARALLATSQEITTVSTDLSERTEAAASALEQQAATMEEIGSVVARNTDQVESAAQFARENEQSAEVGGQVIRGVVDAMQNIDAHSTKIRDIIGVINEIAFQTNILALNAAVEAARAGEQGRGFAVVATEVRNLAQRSAMAAAEIKNLITESVNQVRSGSEVAGQAGTAMQDIVDNARKIKAYLSEVAAASREQTSGVNEAGAAIQDLDRNTQANNTLVHETASAANVLAGQAEQLEQEIANFQVV
ncbi:MAG: hypothetical protein K2X55_11255 [Burkholderiaceae bacterium]|nr:hypothetical protein [Burkholderiaceae bacterium]